MTDAHCHVSCGDPAVREFLIGRDFVGVHPWEAGRNCRIDGWTDGRNDLRARLEADSHLGVGEIGLDRLKDKNVSQEMRELFEAQLELAMEFHRPVVLHGAKCWGQVVKIIESQISNFKSQIPSSQSPYISAAEGSGSTGFATSSIPNSYFLFPNSHFLFPNSHFLIPNSHFPIPNTPLPIPAFLFHGFSRSDGLIPDIVKLNGFISVGPAVLNDHAVNYRALVKKIPLDRLLVETDRTEENAADCPSVRDVLAKTAELRGVSGEALERITDANAEAFAPHLI